MLNCSMIRPVLVIFAAAVSSSAFVSISSSSSQTATRIKFATKTTQLASTVTPTASTSLGVTVGDTKGAVLYLNDINISTGSGIQILKNINFRVDAKERWGIVGPNGCGKSTLLGAITGSVRIDDGQALVASKVKVGYLKQTAVSGSTKTVKDEAASEMEEINSAKQWMNQIGLAKLLLSKPDLLLLDEPSNHLDSSARDWLATYLSNYDGSILLVSHDISLLTKSVNSIAEISGETLIQYVSCNYDKYLTDKEFRAKSAIAEYERNVKEAARLQEFVDKYGASATKASAAQSRVKMIEKMRKEGKLDPPPLSVTAKRIKPSLKLPDPPKGIGEKLLSLVDADIGYDGEPLVKGIDLTINRGVKLILRGPNGAGKSTLLASLRGKLPLIQGKRVENENLRLGVFTQDLAQELDVNARAMDLVTEYAREGKHGDITISNQDARGVMGRLGLSDEKPLRKVGEISGGEKARVALSMFALKASNLLLLDEPSNHLDQECIEALGDSLSNWGGKDGSVVVVSHDRAFCEQVGFTHVGTVKDGKLTIEERGLQERDWETYDISSTPLTGAIESAEAVIELTPEEKAEQDRKRKMAFNAPKRIQKIEELIEKSEAKILEYDDEMMTVGNDVEKLMALTDKKTKEEDTVTSLMEEWEELEEVIAEMASQ
eukprot:scaffold1151_cov144-Skeletonema_menzelii.AAC.4